MGETTKKCKHHDVDPFFRGFNLIEFINLEHNPQLFVRGLKLGHNAVTQENHKWPDEFEKDMRRILAKRVLVHKWFDVVHDESVWRNGSFASIGTGTKHAARCADAG
mmetsp:Transcript_8565/g.18299  ORF Transcript_8565/g.18299 Transcript_8565/m.18299 type:complete len:107 (-) Transcript_8565:279-599(-)